MATIIRSVDIPGKTPEEAFGHFIRGIEENIAPRFFEDVMGPREFKVESDGAIREGVGVTEHLSAPGGGMQNTLHLEVAEFVTGRKYRAVLREPNQFMQDFDETFSFAPKSNATVFTVRFEYEAKGLLGAILDRLFLRRQIVRMWDKALPRIATYIASQ